MTAPNFQIVPKTLNFSTPSPVPTKNNITSFKNALQHEKAYKNLHGNY